MTNVKTKSGFEIAVDDEAMNSMELVDTLVEVDSNDLLAVSKLGEMLLGKDGKKKLYDHLRNDKGIVPVDLFMQELNEIMGALGDSAKN